MKTSVKGFLLTLLLCSAQIQADTVDLSENESQPFGAVADQHVLARPWFQNIDLSGFGAFWYADSGNDGSKPDPAFVVKETTLFVNAESWENIGFFAELQLTQLYGSARDNESQVKAVELYADFRNVLKHVGDDLLNLKVGRFDIPFGEEYLWQDAKDNPMISPTAAYPWFWDEGVMAYGTYKRLGWITAVMNGENRSSSDKSPSKSYSIKLYGKPTLNTYFSFSYLNSGETGLSAIWLANSTIQAVGTGFARPTSSLGVSPSSTVDSTLYQLDSKIDLTSAFGLELSYGMAKIDDIEPFDRDLSWYSVQPKYQFSPNLWLVARYSTIKTDDNNEGYNFSAGFLSDGSFANGPYGFDANRFTREAIALGWRANTNLILKVEVGSDEYEVINVSGFDPSADDRNYTVAELVLSF